MTCSMPIQARASRSALALCAALGLLTASTAPLAAGSMYLQLDDIAGDANNGDHREWIALDRLSWGISADTNYLKGGSVLVGKAVFKNLSWEQSLDTHFPALAQRIATGKAIPSATVHFMKNSTQGNAATYQQLNFDGLFLTKVGFSGSDASFAGAYRTIEMGYRPIDAGKLGKPMITGFDTVAHSKVSSLSPAFSGLAPDATDTFATPDTNGERAYLRLGASGKGESTDFGYDNWTEIEGVAWNIEAESSWAKGGGASVGKPTPGSLSWSQTMDRSVLKVFGDIVSGKNAGEVTLEFVRDGWNGPVTYMQLYLKDVYFTGLDFDDTNVAGSMVFKEITQTLWAFDESGRREKPVSFTWNIPSGSFDLSGTPAPELTGFGRGNLDGNLAASSVGLPPSAPAPVPEPESQAMLLAGLALLWAAARRRAQR